MEDMKLNEVIFIQPTPPLMVKPDPVGELADEALYGMTASILGEENGMLRVRMRYRYEGYVAPGDEDDDKNSLDPNQPDFREDLSVVKKWGSVFERTARNGVDS